MMEPEEVARYRRHVWALAADAADDPAAFAQAVNLLEELQTALRSSTVLLRWQGYTSGDLAAELGVRPSSFRERWYHRQP